MEQDLYWEHSEHIKGENGKKVPFFRNEKVCSTCYSERQKILKRSEKWSLEKPPYEISEYQII